MKSMIAVVLYAFPLKKIIIENKNKKKETRIATIRVKKV